MLPVRNPDDGFESVRSHAVLSSCVGAFVSNTRAANRTANPQRRRTPAANDTMRVEWRRYRRGTGLKPPPQPGARLRRFEGCGYSRASAAPAQGVNDAPMWSFALLAAALVVVTLALLLRPLLSRRLPAGGGAGDDANLDIHRERLREIDAELEAGRITPEERSAARDEVGHQLLGDLDDTAPAEGDRSPAWRSALVVALAVPVLGLGIYLHLGAWQSLVESSGDRSGDESAALLEALEAAVRADPRDAEGWMELGRAAVAFERYHQGLQAFAEAHRLIGDHPDLLADYAEAEAFLSGYRFQGNPARRLERALELDPRHAKSLWLAGFAALQSARPELAIARWEALLAVRGTGSEQARLVEALIARTREELGAAVEEEAAPALVVRVELDERFRGALDGTETLFVYARAAGGPPAPLAARRASARALPLTVRLDDSTSMLPGRTLSSATRVRVGARVSRSGDARAGSGDIQGMSEAIELRAGETEVVVVLNERLP